MFTCCEYAINVHSLVVCHNYSSWTVLVYPSVNNCLTLMITSVSIPYYYFKLDKLLIRTKAFSMIKESRQWISSLFFMEVSISFQVRCWTSVLILCFSYPFFSISYFSVSWFSFLADFSISSFKYSTNVFSTLVYYLYIPMLWMTSFLLSWKSPI